MFYVLFFDKHLHFAAPKNGVLIEDVALLPAMWETRTASDTKKRLERVSGMAFNGQVSGDSPVPGVKIR